MRKVRVRVRGATGYELSLIETIQLLALLLTFNSLAVFLFVSSYL